MKMLMPTSPGGHLKQVVLLAEKLKRDFDITFITYYTPLAEKLLKGYKVEFVIEPKIGIKSWPRKFVLAVQAALLLLKERSNVIVTAGSDVAVPFCYIGKLLGKKIIFIESWSRVRKPSKSGKLVYPIANLFFVQWEDLKSEYPRAVYAGRLM